MMSGGKSQKGKGEEEERGKRVERGKSECFGGDGRVLFGRN